MKKITNILVILLLLLSLTSTNVKVDEYVSISPEKSSTVPVIKILQSQQVKYVDYLGPAAIIMAHHNTYWYDKLKRFWSNVSIYYENVTLIDQYNASTYWFTQLLTQYPSHNTTLSLYYDLYVIIEPDNPLYDEELDAVKNAYENGKSLFLTGDNGSYFNPYHINEITQEYGVQWLDVGVYDDTNHAWIKPWYPLIYTWGTNWLAQKLGDSLTNVEYYGTALNIFANGTNGNTVYIIGTGDTDTYTKNPNGSLGDVSGTDVIPFAAIVNDNNGKMFLSGGTQLISDKPYESLNTGDNLQFIRNVLSWLREDIIVYPDNISVPEILPVGTPYPVYIDITNIDTVKSYDVNVSLGIINLDTNVAVELSQTEFQFTALAAGEHQQISVNALANAPGKVLLKVDIIARATDDPTDIKTYSKVVPLEAVSLKVNVSPSESVLSLAKKTNVNVTVTVENPTVIDSTETKLTITPVNGNTDGVVVKPSSTIELGTVSAGTSKQTIVELEFTKPGDYELVFAVNSTEFTTLVTATFTAKVYARHLVVIDNYHPSYYTIDKFENLTKFLSEEFDVYVLNKTIAKEYIDGAHLVILPRADNTLNAQEIEALKDFVKSGGAVLVLGDGAYNAKYFNPDVINQFLSYYGVEFLKGQIYQGGTDKPYWVNDFLYEENDVAKVLNYKLSVSFNGIAPINITTPVQEKDGLRIEVYPTIVGGDLTYTVNSTGGNVSWPKVVEAVVVLNTSGRIIVVGSSYNFKSEMGEAYMKAYLANRLAWLFGKYEVKVETTVHADVGENVTITINVTNTGPVSIRRFNFTITGVTEGLEVVKGTYEVYLLEPSETENLTLIVKPTKLGTFTLTVSYRAGGIEEEKTTVTVTSTDSVPPTITVTSPENNSEIEVGNATIAFTVKDNYNLSKVVVLIDGEVVFNETVSGTTYDHSFTYEFSEGEHTIVIKAYDEAGNEAVVTIVLTAVAPAPPPSGGMSPLLIIVIIVAVIAVAGGVVYYVYKIKK